MTKSAAFFAGTPKGAAAGPDRNATTPIFTGACAVASKGASAPEISPTIASFLSPCMVFSLMDFAPRRVSRLFRSPCMARPILRASYCSKFARTVKPRPSLPTSKALLRPGPLIQAHRDSLEFGLCRRVALHDQRIVARHDELGRIRELAQAPVAFDHLADVVDDGERPISVQVGVQVRRVGSEHDP